MIMHHSVVIEQLKGIHAQLKEHRKNINISSRAKEISVLRKIIKKKYGAKISTHNGVVSSYVSLLIRKAYYTGYLQALKDTEEVK